MGVRPAYLVPSEDDEVVDGQAVLVGRAQEVQQHVHVALPASQTHADR